MHPLHDSTTDYTHGTTCTPTWSKRVCVFPPKFKQGNTEVFCPDVLQRSDDDRVCCLSSDSCNSDELMPTETLIRSCSFGEFNVRAALN